MNALRVRCRHDGPRSRKPTRTRRGWAPAA